MPVFTKKEQIKFKHCDTAGIVFYPKFFEMLNDLVEDWFDEALGFGFVKLHGGDCRTGVPLVRVESDFKKPGLLGENIEKELKVTGVGKTSCCLEATFRECSDTRDLKVKMKAVIVCVDLDTLRPKEWIASLKERMLLYSDVLSTTQ